MDPQILTIILSSLVAAFSLTLFILTLVAYKKAATKPLMAAIGSAIMFAGALVSICVPFKPLLFIVSMVFIACLIAQTAIVLANSKNDKYDDDDIDLSFPDFETPLGESKVSPDISSTGRKYFMHAAECFSDDSNLEKLVEFINKSLIEKTGSDGGMILLLDDFDDVLTVKSLEGSFPPPYELPSDLPHKELRVKSNMRYARLELTDNILGEIASSGKSELIKDALADSRVFKNGPEEFLQPGSYIFIPVTIKESTVGLIALSRDNGKSPFAESDFDTASALAKFAGAAINCVYVFNQIQEHEFLTKDSDLAAELQKKITLKKLPNIPTLSLGNYSSMSQGICGDYFDIIPARKDRISFIMADVAGKGINSLMIMVMLRAIVRLVVNSKQSASTIMEWINRGISKETSVDHFASIALINYDSVEKKIEYSTAGTTPIYIYKADTKEIKKISKMSEPIGVENALVYENEQMNVECGDIIITFTDGLVETINEDGKPYTVSKLTKLVSENSNLTGKEIAKLVQNDINQYMGNAKQHDDQTLLVIKIQ